MARNLHKEVTDRIIEQLKSGVVPWKQPWSSAGMGGMPKNAITGRGYSGVNVLLLWGTQTKAQYPTSDWLTFKQCQEAGGMVRKGERGTGIVFVSNIIKEDDTTGKKVSIPFLKAFTVFNIAQCDNLSLKANEFKPLNNEQRNELAEEFVASTGATIAHNEQRAYYNRAGDLINMPKFETFTGAATYYSTLFHELTHWAGAESRLNRVKGKRFGDAEYTFEELVAELGSAFLCAEFQFDNAGADASYIDHWVRFLTDHDTALMAAASQASKAAEYMRGLALAAPLQIAA